MPKRLRLTNVSEVASPKRIRLLSGQALRTSNFAKSILWHEQRNHPAAVPSESIRAAPSDFEARRLLRRSERHRRQRAPDTGPMLVPSLQRYQACPLSKPSVGSISEMASTAELNGLRPP